MAMVRAVCRFIEQHLDEPLTLPQIAEEFRRSPFHLQRTFKGVLGITPKEYADACRLKSLKHNLQAGHSVTRAMYDAGYSSSSRLYERTASQLGMTPDKYRRGAIAATIRYALSDSPLGTDVDCGDGEGNLHDPVREDGRGTGAGADAGVSVCTTAAR